MVWSSTSAPCGSETMEMATSPAPIQIDHVELSGGEAKRVACDPIGQAQAQREDRAATPALAPPLRLRAVDTGSRALPADGGRLVGDIDAYGTPRDTAPATDAAAAAVLVVPGPELVREPLAIARAGVGPHGEAVQIAVPAGEAGIPFAQVLRLVPAQRGRILLGVAEAGRADRRCSCRRTGNAGQRRPSVRDRGSRTTRARRLFEGSLRVCTAAARSLSSRTLRQLLVARRKPGAALQAGPRPDCCRRGPRSLRPALPGVCRSCGAAAARRR